MSFNELCSCKFALLAGLPSTLQHVDDVQTNDQHQKDDDQDAQHAPESRSVQIGQRHVHDTHQSGLLDRSVISVLVELLQELFATLRSDRANETTAGFQLFN